MRLLVGATLCGRPKKTIGKWQLIIKNSSTLRGEDKGEGELTTLLIADWKKIGFLLEFTPDLFRRRNDKLKKRLQTRNVIPAQAGIH